MIRYQPTQPGNSEFVTRIASLDGSLWKSDERCMGRQFTAETRRSGLDSKPQLRPLGMEMGPCCPLWLHGDPVMPHRRRCCARYQNLRAAGLGRAWGSFRVAIPVASSVGEEELAVGTFRAAVAVAIDVHFLYGNRRGKGTRGGRNSNRSMLCCVTATDGSPYRSDHLSRSQPAFLANWAGRKGPIHQRPQIFPVEKLPLRTADLMAENSLIT